MGLPNKRMPSSEVIKHRQVILDAEVQLSEQHAQPVYHLGKGLLALDGLAAVAVTLRESVTHVLRTVEDYLTETGRFIKYQNEQYVTRGSLIEAASLAGMILKEDTLADKIRELDSEVLGKSI